MWSTEISKGKSYEETVKNQILETLENMYVLEDHMGDYKVEITEEEKKKISEAAKAFDEANGLEEKEAVSGTTENVERMLTLVTIQEKMQKAMVADVDTEVSDEEAAQKYAVCQPFSDKDKRRRKHRADDRGRKGRGKEKGRSIPESS